MDTKQFTPVELNRGTRYTVNSGVNVLNSRCKVVDFSEVLGEEG
jgi:hypothetical protein